jgi:AcrR family transcriptional regulator
VKDGSGAHDLLDGTPAAGRTRGARREQATADTRGAILSAARGCLLADGYANLSTRRVADAAGVPLSQIHYHFGSKQQLILAVLAAQTERLLERQGEMYAGPEPLWVRWKRACEFLEVDLASGYVRILQELIAAGWSDPELAALVRKQFGGWFELLTAVAQRTSDSIGGLGPFTPAEVAALMGLSFVGAESAILLGMTEEELPARSALAKVGEVIREIETRRAKEMTDGH